MVLIALNDVKFCDRRAPYYCQVIEDAVLGWRSFSSYRGMTLHFRYLSGFDGHV